MKSPLVEPIDMHLYLNKLWCVCNILYKKGSEEHNTRKKFIALAIKNYVFYMTKLHNVVLEKVPEDIELVDVSIIKKYIDYKGIKLFDWSKIDDSNIDVNDKNVLEAFVLSHVYNICGQKV
jgi:hypothetical protein